MTREKLYIFDTTLRDGEQTAGVNLTIEEKVQIAKQLERLGVDVIEAGFAISSPADFEAIQQIAKEVKNSAVCSLARAVEADIKAAWEALKEAKKPRIHTFIATSDIHLKYKLKMSKEEALKRAVSAVKLIQDISEGKAEVEFSAEDAGRTDLKYLYEILEAVIEAGAKVVNIPDTVGYAVPDEWYEKILSIKENVPNIDKAIISVHCHNDLGLATANSLMAVKAGARQVECTVNGIGERAGNAAMEEIVMAINVRPDQFSVYTDIDTTQIYRTSQLVSRLTGMMIARNKPIVGENAFAHESGIHQHGVLAKRETYEIMKPEDIGLKESKIVLGKHSGRHAFKKKLEEMGILLPEEKVEEAFRRFKELASRKKEIYDIDIELIVEGLEGEKERKFELIYNQAVSGEGIIPSATVKIKTPEGEKLGLAVGNGPVDATYRAIKNALGYDKEIKLKDFKIRALTAGTDALAEVFLTIESEGIKVSGRGVDPDIVRASALAFLEVLDRLERRKYRKKPLE
ncbi:2-isopropylmalate synthase [Desulfurobacterium thermolithotrophum DSM 11699]|uniref:2-isopropylmalate synthase n=1 Tax=Desulfurobacterium thermolithotrophum (strain DSM 11699 / BSA) TaxID=868864 RepID=F0S1B2_DESTD|nr:2-isopropylmalate synthase [Desulfurobacterium thermolithotrophum]ADY72843.1 2-isopropylmalate synthase [Desulfurobacterium thermolithotrophum DSM 11699]